MPENLNQHGLLFGGYLLLWVDEVSWITASMDYPGCKFVTIGMDNVEFKKNVKAGSILLFDTKKIREGNTSVQYITEVSSTILDTGEKINIFSTKITFVRVDKEGEKLKLPK